MADQSPTPGYEPAKSGNASSSPAGESRAAGAPSTHVIHASLVRPALYAGAEPAVVMMEVSVAFALVFVVGFHVVTLLLALFWLTVVHSAMMWVAKQDPQMTTLYVRSLFAQDYYAARADVRAAPPVVRTSVPSWS
jgi:type IV secretory pathway TrbD component